MNMSGKYEGMLKQFETYYPGLYKQTVDWWPSGRLSVIVKLRDGLLFEYYSLDNTIRRVQPDNYTKDATQLRKDIGNNIRKAITAKGMSHSEIAARSGITEAMLSRYLHGTSMPGIDKIYSIAATVGCSIREIIDESYID